LQPAKLKEKRSNTMNNTDKIREAKKRWLEKAENSSMKRTGIKFTTISDIEVQMLYTPDDLEGFDYMEKLGFPGEYPYTRGIHYNMYRGRLWTMRQFAGFGTPEDTNQRFKFLLKHGETGLSVAFDLPTLMGIDADDPMAEGEVGVCGVSVSSLADMEIVFKDIPLDQVSTSMTINAPAAMIWAMYLVTAEKQGVKFNQLRGTIQNDILKEYIAQKEWIYPPEPSIKLIVDTIRFAKDYVPQWNPISISGYHIREAGATAVQELAFTLADGFAYVEACINAGMDVDEFAPRLSFFFNSHLDFFEEIAKFRAARRIWARYMRERYGAKNPRSWMLRFHTQTAGCSLTAQQPENNIVRTAFEALAAVLGGTQSLHTNSMDETYALPTEKAAKIALRTQQIIAYEIGVANVIDPLGGSYYIESLTNKIEEEVEKYFRKIEAYSSNGSMLEGVIKGIEDGFFQREIAESAYRYQQELDRKERIIVGVNEFVEDEPVEIPILRIPPEVADKQKKRLAEVRATRNQAEVERALAELKKAAEEDQPLMPKILDCVRAYCTLGEMTATLKEVWGVYQEPLVF